LLGRVERRRCGVGMGSGCKEDWAAGEGDESVSRVTGECCGEEEDESRRVRVEVSGLEVAGLGRSTESWGVLGKVGQSSE